MAALLGVLVLAGCGGEATVEVPVPDTLPAGFTVFEQCDPALFLFQFSSPADEWDSMAATAEEMFTSLVLP